MNDAEDSMVRAATPGRPLSAMSKLELGRIRVVATDVDGTLTTSGALTAPVVDAIAQLCDAGIEVIPVSGRAYGELAGLVRYLPGVGRGIAENGLLESQPDRAHRWLCEQPDRRALREKASTVQAQVGVALRSAADAPIRLGDLAFELDGLPGAQLFQLRERAASVGLHCVWSNVHIHFSELSPDKGRGLTSLLQAEFDRGALSQTAVLTIGDAPNDAGLFNPARFGVSVGTADVLKQRQAFDHLPAYVSDQREGAAFLELAALLLDPS